jgi:hypothetical protein
MPTKLKPSTNKRRTEDKKKIHAKEQLLQGNFDPTFTRITFDKSV